MFEIVTNGAYCNYPRQDYNPADLPQEYHPAVVAYFRRWAERDMLPEGRNRQEREGLRERAEEAASVAYLAWLTNKTSRIPRGAHASALCGIRRLMQRSGWQGATGYRRAARRAATAERLAMMERNRQRHAVRPDAVAVAAERLALPVYREKAARMAKRLGLTVRDMVRQGCGFGVE